MPIDIKKLLNATGYDNEISLSVISEKNVSEIENFLNENRHILENTIYQNINPFEFRPGDRTLLLSLPKIIHEYKELRKAKKRLPKVVQNQKSEADLKTELLNKLMNYTKSRKYDIQLKIEDITEFLKDQQNARCRVKCVFCDMNIVCTYNSFWRVSNYETHFKNHIKIDEKKINEIQDTQSSKNQSVSETPDDSIIISIDNPELLTILNA